MRRLLGSLALIVAVLVVYVAAGKLGLSLAFVHKSATAVWPPSGIALAALLVFGNRVVPAVFIGALLVNATTDGSTLTSLAVATGNTLEAVVGAWLVRRFAGGPDAFLRVRNVFRFAALAGVGATMLSPTIGVTALVLAGYGSWDSYGLVWRTWWLGDAMGVLIVGPVLLLWSEASRRSPSRGYAALASILLCGVAVVSALVLGGRSELGFLAPLLVVWIAFVLDARETLTGVLLVAAVATWRTLDGFGPFAGTPPNEALLSLQAFIAVNSITGLGIGAVLHDRARARADLERQVAERTASLVKRNRELGQLEGELRLAKDAAEQASAAKSAFLATMSHEIRTPLHAIVALGDLLAVGEADAERRRDVARLRRASTRLLELVNDVLDLERVEAGHLTLQQVDYDLRALLAEVAELFEVSASAKGLALLFEVAPEVPRRAVGDAGRLRQVIANLVTNALKFTERGRVVVRAALEPDARLHLSVADTGIGIACEEQARIFERFVQSDGSAVRGQQGSGLGLAIAAELVKLMGGRLWVESEPGAGSTFHVVLEMPAAAPEAAPARPSVSAGARPLRILHVDDNEESRSIVAAYLRGSRHRVDAVTSGAAALARLQVEPFDLVLVDLRMPGEGGLAVIRRIRAREAQERLAPMAIVTLTADATTASRQLALEAGATGYASKPIAHAAFLDLLEAFSDEPRAARPSPLDPDPEMEALVAKYRRARVGDVQTLRVALRDGDFDRILQLGHDMKGSGGIYGFAAITRLGGALSIAAENNDAAAVGASIADLEAALAST